ncbi:MAG: glycosyltransferase family 4 protein [Planctomycetota bacterium]
MIRIALLNPLFAPDLFGGLERVLLNLTGALSQRGAVIRVLCENRGAQDVERIRPGLVVHRVPPMELGRKWRWADRMRCNWWDEALRQLPEALEADVLWAHDPFAASAVLRAGRAEKLLYRPTFCYEAMDRVGQCAAELAPLRRGRLARKLDKLCYESARWVIDESHNLRRQQELYYGERDEVHVIHNGVSVCGEPRERSEARRHLGVRTPEDELLVGFAGRPGDAVKDLPFLLQAMRWTKASPAPKLVVIGDDEHRYRGPIEAARLGVIERVVFAGKRDDLPELWPGLDALVLPSRFETFGNVLLEAQAHGVPVVARRDDVLSRPAVHVPGPELIEDGVTGLLVDAHDPGDLSQAIDRLADEPELRESLGEAARQARAGQDWGYVADRYLDLLDPEQDQGFLPNDPWQGGQPGLSLAG